MKYGIKTLDDFDLKGKKILIRVDINSTIMRKENKLMNLLRIKELEDTLNELTEAAVVIIAHQGRPGRKDFTSLAPHAEAMKELYGDRVKFVDDLFGSKAIKAIKELKTGEVLVLENVRFYSEEIKLTEDIDKMANSHIVKNLAPHFDLYVNDAYGAAHRSSPSLLGFTKVLPSCMGKILEKEINTMEENIFGNPKKPVVFSIGGAKVKTKFNVMKNLLENDKADLILVSGLLQNIMLAGAGINIGEINKKPIKNFDEYVGTAKEIYEKYKDKIKLPTDLALNDDGDRKNVSVNELNENKEPSNDIGKDTINEYTKLIKEAGTVVANGPPGVFENPPFNLGTKKILESMGESSAFTAVGGGEMGGYCQDLKIPIDFISTGGGAMLDYLTGKKLPVIEALENASK
ncbi:MAG: phosphoglycerate kinase [Candidatus Lokiarchaeota archaeon]|nr:phosphoglycerate kinase [Candidatus Lokiarchaeota archaeon]